MKLFKIHEVMKSAPPWYVAFHFPNIYSCSEEIDPIVEQPIKGKDTQSSEPDHILPYDFTF